MSDDLMEELRIMANEHDDELCRYALDRFALLEEAIDQYRKALSQSSSRIEALEAALRKIGEGDVCVSLMTHPAQCGRAYQARAALGEKKDD